MRYAVARGALVVMAVVCATLASACQPAGVAGGRPTGDPGPAFVHADRLHLNGRTITLGSPADPGPAGWLAPVGVPSPDGRYLAYRGRGPKPDGAGPPEIRIRQLAGGAETVLAAPATSLAWGVDGRIGYAVGDDPLRGDDQPGGRERHGVFVRRWPAGHPERWTDGTTNYVVAAWAGPRLLAYQLDRSGVPGLLVLDGPKGRRSLGRGALVAVSPDGERAFVGETGDTPTPNVRVVRVADGTTLARLDLTGTGVAGVGYAGDWSGDRVVAAAWPDPVVFRVGEPEIRIDRRLRIGSDGHPYGLREPGFFGDSVLGWAAGDTSENPPTVQVWCPLAGAGASAERCVDQARFTPPGAYPVRNPSRPLPLVPLG